MLCLTAFSDQDLQDSTTTDDQTKFGFDIDSRIRFGLLTSHVDRNGTIGELQAGIGLGNDRKRAGVIALHHNGTLEHRYRDVYYISG